MLIRKVLVAIDFSESSQLALEHAREIAASMGAELDLLHVWNVPVFLAPDAMIGSSTAQPLARHIAQQAKDLMADCVRNAKEQGAAIHETFVVEGNIAHTICDKAVSGGYDLLVLGTQGRTGLTHLLLGSVAETVVRHSKVPVLTVRNTEYGKT